MFDKLFELCYKSDVCLPGAQLNAYLYHQAAAPRRIQCRQNQPRKSLY